MRLAISFALCSALLSTTAQSIVSNDQRPVQLIRQTDQTALLDLHRELVERPSITDSEHNVTAYLTRYLRQCNFSVELQPVADDREDVFAYYGCKRKTRVLVTSHIDTVPPFFPYERRGEEIWGRGTADAKGSVAAQVIAARQLFESDMIAVGDVALLSVVGEEKGGVGMKAANDLGVEWETVIFGEPTELKLASGHKGGLAFTVDAHGIAGHSGYPELGRNAIDLLVQGLSALSQAELPGSKEFGDTTFNVGLIQGGVAGNVIPANASATVVVRTASYDLGGIKRIIERMVRGVSPWLSVTWANYGIGPVPIDHDVEGSANHQRTI